MAAAGAQVQKLRFTPSLSSKAKACAIHWIALLLPQLGTCLLGAIESKAGGQVSFWEAAPCSDAHTKAGGSEWGSISHASLAPCLYYHKNPLEGNKAFFSLLGELMLWSYKDFPCWFPAVHLQPDWIKCNTWKDMGTSSAQLLTSHMDCLISTSANPNCTSYQTCESTAWLWGRGDQTPAWQVINHHSQDCLPLETTIS